MSGDDQHPNEASESWIHDFRSELRSELSSVRFPNLSELAAGFVAAASLILVAGGIVLWIRVDHAALPPQDVLPVLPREAFFVVGAKELALPVALTWLAYLILRPAGNVDRKRSSKRKFSRSRLLTQIDWFVGLFYGLAVFILFSAPWGWVAVWSAFVLAVFAYVLDHRVAVGFGGLLVAGAVIAVGSAVTQELDTSVTLNRTTIELQRGDRIHGLYLSSSADWVRVGQEGKIVFIPTRQIKVVRIGTPPPEPDDPPSLGRRLHNFAGSLF